MNGRLGPAAVTVGAQILLVLVAWTAWTLVGRDEIRLAGKVLAAVAGAVCAFAALALLGPLVRSLRPARD